MNRTASNHLSTRSIPEAPTPRPLDCPTCSGAGCFGDGGPVTSDCRACGGSGIARCRACPSQAVVVDANAEGDGPACLDCAARCFYGCGEIAVEYVSVTDDQGDCERDEPMCEGCAEEEGARRERIRKWTRWAVEQEVA